MPDCYSKETRSRVMSHIRSKNTKPEIILRKKLWSMGCRGYRLKSKLPGKPDIVFTKFKVAVFVDGCFWHKCPKCFVEPKSNREYWIPKINRNVERDLTTNAMLEEMGWTVLRIWEHEIKEDADNPAERIIKILNEKSKNTL